VSSVTLASQGTVQSIVQSTRTGQVTGRSGYYYYYYYSADSEVTKLKSRTMTRRATRQLLPPPK